MMRLKKLAALFLVVTFMRPCFLAAQDYEDYEGYEDYEDYDGENTGYAQGLVYENEETGYFILIDDMADLLSEDEEEALVDEMFPLTAWGNAYFCTDSTGEGSSENDLAATLYEEKFGHRVSGAIFLIDMSRRKLAIHCDGEVRNTVTTDYTQTITDNIYRKATAGDYYACAAEAFRQMITLLEGGKISQPMKHVNNALLALMLALFICYLYMSGKSKTASEKKQPEADPVFNGHISHLDVIPGRLTKRVIQSSSSGRGYSGGGGGGHSGGGGSHGF